MLNPGKSNGSLKDAKIAIIGIPFDDYSSFLKGAALAPPLIRKAFHSESSNLWSETGINLGQGSSIADVGDVHFSALKNPLTEIETAITGLLEKSLSPISLGGDHSITYPIIRAFSQKFDKLNILQFDAHPDLYDEYQGNRFSHACPFARIMEIGLVQRLVQVAIRTMNDHQKQQAKKFNVEVIHIKDWHNNLKLEFDCPLYISFDMDALDPAFAPGVSHHEPGGFSVRQVIQIIQRIESATIVGADIVEYNPHRDLNGLTAMVSAKILKELAGKMLSINN